MNISVFIFISIMALAFGYAVSNTQNFNFWKLLFFALFLLPIIVIFGMGKYHAIVVLISFATGFLLPYAHSLKFIGNGLSDFINAVRYKDAYDDIKRKEAEVDDLRKKYEQAKNAENQQKQSQEYERRKQQSQDYRKQQEQQKKQKSQSERKEKSNKSTDSSQQNSNDYIKSRYLEILGLDPNKTYSQKEIKTAHRRQCMKYHPDRHQTKVKKEMDEKTKLINKAYEWLALNMGA
jgi:preprotein translocase subunit SecF